MTFLKVRAVICVQVFRSQTCLSHLMHTCHFLRICSTRKDLFPGSQCRHTSLCLDLVLAADAGMFSTPTLCHVPNSTHSSQRRASLIPDTCLSMVLLPPPLFPHCGADLERNHTLVLACKWLEGICCWVPAKWVQGIECSNGVAHIPGDFSCRATHEGKREH